ncbi:MAG: inner membrane-spanning protein YciB [Gammaproteobacteria bacterium]|nr:inner membrane-spanning protein YciB [Gammaproteobacteria bacterium]
MTQLLDFVPIALFVGVFFAMDIYWATGALMVGVTVQVLAYRLLGKPVSRELNMTFWASLVFGALTLIFRNETFIQWKPTIVNWLLAASLVGSYYVGRTNLLKQLLGKQLSLVDEVWTRLNFGWAVGFFIAGALNLVVAYNFSMEFWVGYKLVGGFALTFLYIIITMVYLARKGFLEGHDDADAGAESGADPAPGSRD